MSQLIDLQHEYWSLTNAYRALQANIDGMIIVSNYSGEFRKMKMEFKTKKNTQFLPYVRI